MKFRSNLFVIGFCFMFLIDNSYSIDNEAIDWKVSRFRQTTEKIIDAYNGGETSVEQPGRAGRWKQEITCGGFFFGKERLGMVESDGTTLYISFKGANLFSQSFWSYFSPYSKTLNGYDGYIHAGIATLYQKIVSPLRDLFQMSLNQEGKEPIEFVFSGYGIGGALALYAAADFSHWQQGNILQNQVKVITFSSPKVVDHDFKNNIHHLIGQTNIIQFINVSDITTVRPFSFTNVGIPIYISSSEQMRDEGIWNTILKSKIFYGMNLASLVLNISQFYNISQKYISQPCPCLPHTHTLLDMLPIGISTMILLDFILNSAQPTLPSSNTFERSVHYTNVNIQNAISNSLCDRRNIPQDVGTFGIFDINRSLMGL